MRAAKRSKHASSKSAAFAEPRIASRTFARKSAADHCECAAPTTRKSAGSSPSWSSA